MEIYYHLEYCERDGFFYFADDYDNPSIHYRVICKHVPKERCEEFAELMSNKYRSLRIGEGDFPSFETIKSEFHDFLLT